MPFLDPKDPQDPNDPKTLQWLVRGKMKATFFFEDPALAATISYGIAPSNLSGYLIKGFIGDDDLSDDIIDLEAFEDPLQQVAPSKRSLSVFLMPRERSGKEFNFSLSFFSDQNGFDNQDYNFRSEGKPIGIRIMTKFV